MSAPSISRWGLDSKICRSLNVPGSLSSPLTQRYFGLSVFFGMNVHFSPVGKHAPPRPRRLDFFTSSVTSSGFIPSALPEHAGSRRWPRRRRSCGGRGCSGGGAVPWSLQPFQDRVDSLLRIQVLVVSSPICTIGAVPQDPRHSASTSVNLPSGVVSPTSICEAVLNVLEDPVAVPEHAGDVRADFDLVPADRLPVEHRVERHDAEDVMRRDAEQRRATAFIPSSETHPWASCHIQRASRTTDWGCW